MRLNKFLEGIVVDKQRDTNIEKTKTIMLHGSLLNT